MAFLQILQPRHVLAERQLAVGAELVAAFREQHVAGDDPLVLRLHLGDLGLFRGRLGARLLQLLSLLFVGALRYASAQRQCRERDEPSRACQIYDHCHCQMGSYVGAD